MGGTFDVERVRAEFPALSRRIGAEPAVFLDGPGGSQVPFRVLNAVARYLAESNANCGGAFATSVETDAMIEQARRAAADFVGATEPDTIAFGANMTTLTLALARALSRTWKRGDEIVVTRLDHDANVTPWIQAVRDMGAVVRWIGIRREDCTLELADLEKILGDRTRLVAVGCASNAVGTINPVERVIEAAHRVGALVFLDAVHSAPHTLLEVETWGCDFLCCSAYKFFGPHVGILYGKKHLLAELPVYKVRPASDEAPYRWETGTQCHEGIAGTLEAIDYLADLGRERHQGGLGRRAALAAAFESIRTYERNLCVRLLDRLEPIEGVRIHGITDRSRLRERTPTVSFAHVRLGSREIAQALARRGIFVWSGNFYALALTEELGLEPDGLVRVGLLHYNTEEEIERLARALEELG